VSDDRWSVRVTLALAFAAALLIGFVVVSVVADVPMVRPSGRTPYLPGYGVVLLVAVGVVGLVCLVDAVLGGRARRHDRQGLSAKRSERT